MTRKEQIKIAMKESVTETIYSSGYGFTPQAIDLLECAWVKGAEWADKTMLDKVCEWLRNYNTGVRGEEFINEFREAMKGEQP